MILVLNVGNTRTHIGLFTLGHLRHTWKLSTDRRRTADEYAMQIQNLLGDATALEGAILSSVVPRVADSLATAVRNATHIEPMILGPDTDIGIVNGYENPAEVGMDRLANAVGGNLIHGAPLLMLDIGTAVTLDYLAAPERPGAPPIYLGGAIMPGLEMSVEALARGTAKLPPIDLAEPKSVLGRTTVESIRSGLIHGYLGAMTSLVDRARDEIGDSVRVVATGGDAERFSSQMPFLHAIEPDLALFGLRQIYGINNNCPLGET